MVGFSRNADNFNVSFVYGALSNALMIGTCNIVVGYQVLIFNIIGNGNTTNGVYALYSNATGIYNTAVGYASTIGNLNNTITIVFFAAVDASNQVRLGNYMVTSAGGVSWITVSDDRANINANISGQEFINHL